MGERDTWVKIGDTLPAILTELARKVEALDREPRKPDPGKKTTRKQFRQKSVGEAA